MMLDDGVNGAIRDQIQSGTLLLMFEVSGIESFHDDSMVVVHILLGAVPAGATIMTDGSGLAPDQMFTTMQDIATVTGTIEGGRLHAESTATIPISFVVMDRPVTLMLRDVVIGSPISDLRGLSEGELGGVVRIDDVVCLPCGDAIDRATIEALAMPDIDPDATGEHCNAISAGFGFTTVDAWLE
jgi:hypothetical protein